MNKTLDIIIPAFNAAETIKDCIESLEKQDDIPNGITYSIIIVDDGSSDNTKDVVTQLCNRFNNITYIYQHNNGVSSARNKGIKSSEAELITFVDADDTVTKDYISTIANNIKNYDWMIFEYIYINGNHRNICSSKECHNFSDLYDHSLFNNPFNKVYRKKLIRDVFPVNIKMGEDLAFNVYYARNIKSYKILTKPLYNYIVRNGSAMGSYNRQYLDDYIFLLDTAEKSGFFDNNHLESNYQINILRNFNKLFDCNKSKKERYIELDYAVRKLVSGKEIKNKSYASLVYNAIRRGHKKEAYFLIEAYSLARKAKHKINL